MSRARQLSAESIAGGDPTGWFERLYVEGEAGDSVVPWIQGTTNPVLAGWAAGRSGAGGWRCSRWSSSPGVTSPGWA